MSEGAAPLSALASDGGDRLGAAAVGMAVGLGGGGDEPVWPAPISTGAPTPG